MAVSNKCTHNAGVQLPTERKEEDKRQEAGSEGQASPVDTAVLAPSTEDEAALLPPPIWREEFEFPGVLASVPECREQVMEFVNRHCPDEGDQIDILVAVQEALANAALHGCHDDPSTRIHCVVTADLSDITVAVRDPGPGFDPGRADPEKFQATKLTHGRGICLMRSLMSEVSFAHHGAEIVLRKHLNRDSRNAD